MNYKFIDALVSDLNYLENAKLNSILDYANNLSEDEIIKIKDYVKRNTIKDINDYKLIVVNDTVVGCFLVKIDNNNAFIDEIYIDKNYRSKGIGSSIIKSTISKYNSTFLWVYKDNIKAISLYKHMGFKIIDETENRYYMKFTI